MLRPRPAKVREWTDRFERFQRSKVSLTQFCRDEGVSMPSFYQWRKRIVANPASKTIREQQSPATGSAVRRIAAKAIDFQQPAPKANARPIRITIESIGIVIHCDCDSLQVIDTVLSWANGQRESGFKQLIVRS